MADVQLAVNELGSLAASLGRTSVSSAQVSLALGGGRMPNLLEAIRAKVGLPQNVEPSARDVGTALRLLANATGLLEGYRGGHAKAASWRPTEAGKGVAAEAPPKVANVEPPKRPSIQPVGAMPSPEELARLTKKPVAFEELCNKLDASPAKVRASLEKAREAGFLISVAGDVVSWQNVPDPDLDRVIPLAVPPVVGDRVTVAVISDTHFGSRYCLREQIKDFVHWAYSRGARVMFHIGDVVDGCYRHGRFELSHHGLDDQVDDAIETFPHYPDMQVPFICGNHDWTFYEATGCDPGRLMAERFASRGRSNWRYVGARGAMVTMGGVRAELWHPKKAGAYALSYHLQNHIRDTAIGHKPDLLLVGHWHTWVYLEQRGVHALAAGTFQGGGSAFSKSLGGAPSIGGTLISWEKTEHGTLRTVAVERRAYYEHEQPREVG